MSLNVIHKSVVWYDIVHFLHSGPKNTSEIPERIDVIINNLPKNIELIKFNTILFKYKTILTRFNCEFCTFQLESDNEFCMLCDNLNTSEWCYVNHIEGDTTYMTPYTKIIVERAIIMIKEAIEKQIITKNNFTFCLTRPPGHHACSNNIVGFCHKNFAIEALDYLTNTFKKKCLILDIDAHYGDGTVIELEKRTYGYYVSLHGYGPNIYPGSGAYLVNERFCSLPLSSDTNSKEWLNKFKNEAIPFIKNKTCDIIILSAGFDGHKDDKIAPLLLDTYVYYKIGLILKDLSIPIFSVLEGGYELSILGNSVASLINGLKP